MNERTKQLWEESQQWNGSDDGRGGLKILESVEKFAELIVRESARVADIADENKCEWIGGNILTHFGVEE